LGYDIYEARSDDTGTSVGETLKEICLYKIENNH
jgi:hypothetical protein